MNASVASCSCGHLRVRCEGEPVRRSMCHCLACQRRTGSIFGVQARWPRERIRIEGPSKAFVRTGDSGSEIEFHFCPECGSTVYWFLALKPEFVAIAVGAFADPAFPPPRISVYESRRHRWSLIADDVEMEHSGDDRN